MNILALIASGIVENVIRGDPANFPGSIDVTDVIPRPAPGWMFDGENFTPPLSPETPPFPDAPRLITRRALRSRFTIPELVGIEIASLDDPAAPIETRQTAATLRVLLATLNSADFIDLDFAEARIGVQMIGQFGLLSAERVTEILDTPVDDSERP